MNRKSHNEYVKEIKKYLQETQDSYILFNNFEYQTKKGKPAEVDILLLSKNNSTAIFMDFKGRNSGGNVIRAWENYNKFKDTYNTKYTIGICVSPDEVHILDGLKEDPETSELEGKVMSFFNNNQGL